MRKVIVTLLLLASTLTASHTPTLHEALGIYCSTPTYNTNTCWTEIDRWTE